MADIGDPLTTLTYPAVLGDDVMAAALIDRLVYHCHSVNIRRMRHHTELSEALHAAPPVPRSSLRGRRRARKPKKEAAAG